ncbi:Inosose dehydratase [Planctomycetes bacterium Pan216]|uniref:Inosose dehydratase n=1 Tax=Kolteria novifilia TaxID=2527975 RepID=A0A518BA52_9BACT|nr:Inosose dehydratase [Planctomycetes bacterium Pan216]
MQYLYFSKHFRDQNLPEIASILTKMGVDGADFAVRPGYPVNPTNVAKALPEAISVFKSEGLAIPLVTAPTNMTDPSTPEAARIFEACGENGVRYIKIGYFRFMKDYAKELAAARKQMEGFAKLGEKTGVRACYHTHSGNYLGCNCAAQLLLLEGIDPHYVGSYVDTGHDTVDGAPLRMGLSTVAEYFSLLAIKDMRYEKTDKGWRHVTVPVGEGIVDWKDVRRGLIDQHYNGIISLHAEYHTADLDERIAKAQSELAFLKKHLAT